MEGMRRRTDSVHKTEFKSVQSCQQVRIPFDGDAFQLDVLEAWSFTLEWVERRIIAVWGTTVGEF